MSAAVFLEGVSFLFPFFLFCKWRNTVLEGEIWNANGAVEGPVMNDN